MLLSEQYDCVILDLGLPSLDGLQVLARLRKRGGRTPVLILTARDRLSDRVDGLDLGADDYLSKPFDLPELEARVRALIRRAQGAASADIVVGGLNLDTVGKIPLPF
jgi:DNA-binding response OmpR family regulator